MTRHRVFFLCSGNYYRSRYAEMYFNMHVPEDSEWRALSRGLRINPGNEGPISRAVLDRLRNLGASMPDMDRAPIRFQPREVTRADRLIAMDEDEHRPYVEQDLAGWRSRVEYWHVPDVGMMPVEQAFSLIESGVKTLLQKLSSVAVELQNDRR